MSKTATAHWNRTFLLSWCQTQEPLFGDGLGLDSIDSLELIVLLKKEYGIDIRDPREGRKVLVDVATMAEYIQEHGTGI